MENYYLYRHIRLDKNEPFYVGIGTTENKYLNTKASSKRYARAYSKKRSKYWKNIITKTDYEVEILLESDDYEFIKQKEIEFIALYGRRDLGKGTLVNMTDGGEGTLGIIVSLEKREKLRQINLGKKVSEETIAKLKITSKRENHEWSTKVFDWKTSQTFNAIIDASKFYDIPYSTICKKLRGDVTNDTTLCYLEDYKNGLVDCILKEKRTTGRKVINTKTNELFSSLIKASKSVNIKSATLRAQLTGVVSNRTTFIFYEQ